MADNSGSLQGKLLVAGPVLTTPISPGPSCSCWPTESRGASASVLNRPTVTAVSSPLPEWEELASSPAVVFVGGPVSEGTICLARVKSEIRSQARGTCHYRAPWGRWIWNRTRRS